MQLQCSRCHRTLEFLGERPLFCSYCGNSLAAKETCEAVTVAPPPPTGVHEAVTVAGESPTDHGTEEMPSSLGDYRLLRRLGGGGMGTVYEAEDASNGRRVALKIISADYARSADAVQRFRQEGRLASTISHPRCVFVLGADETGGRPYIVMELMPGPTLQDLLDKEGPLPISQAVAKALDVIEGLQEAHRLDVVHRDVKPSNCFLEEDGRVKVGDFGLSKSLTVNAHMTRTGAFMGTLLYAAPEQVRGERVDKQTDVYAVCATLYSLLVGQAPFQTGDAAATLARIAADDPPALRVRRPDAPVVLEKILLRGLARDRARRYRDLEELRRDLIPFAPGTDNAAPLGLRFLALLFDWILLTLVVLPIAVIYGVLTTGSWGGLIDPSFSSTNPGFLLLGPSIFLLYFFVCEGWSDAALGKRLLRLRVRTTANDYPRLSRGVVRGLIFYVLFNLNNIVSQVVMMLLLSPETRQDPIRMSRDPFFMWFALSQWLFVPLQYGLLLGTMRKTNGFRGLHEWASATKTIAISHIAEKWAVRPHSLEAESKPSDQFPKNLGPFAVSGVLRHHDQRGVLLGEDPGLGRKVILWVRPATEGSLPQARRDLRRPTRLRWLEDGQHEELLWDAFPVPHGCPLPVWVAEKGPLPWRLVRPILESLTTELDAACDDETLPRTLSLDQIWVDTAGRVLLLEAPLNVSAPTEPEAEENDLRSLRLLRQVIQLTLEGKRPDPEKSVQRVRAPLPGSVRVLVDRLFGDKKPIRHLKTWQKALDAIKDQVQETTRSRRAIQAAVLTAFLFIPLCTLLSPGMVSVGIAAALAAEVRLGNKTLTQMQQASSRDFVCMAVAPSSFTRLGAVGLLSSDLKTQEQLTQTIARLDEASTARREVLNPVSRWFLLATEEVQKQQIAAIEERAVKSQESNLRPRARQRADNRPPNQREVARVMVVMVSIVAGTYIVWTFLLRTNISSLIAGLTLVRRDGQRASRLRCAWRSALAWIGFVGPLVGSVWLEAEFWQGWHIGSPDRSIYFLSQLTWWWSWAMLPLYLLLALWRPTRGPHDILAGTYVVPR